LVEEDNNWVVTYHDKNKNDSKELVGLGSIPTEEIIYNQIAVKFVCGTKINCSYVSIVKLILKLLIRVTKVNKYLNRLILSYPYLVGVGLILKILYYPYASKVPSNVKVVEKFRFRREVKMILFVSRRRTNCNFPSVDFDLSRIDLQCREFGAQGEELNIMQGQLMKVLFPRREILNYLFYRCRTGSGRLIMVYALCEKCGGQCITIDSTVVRGFKRINRCLKDFFSKQELWLSIYLEVVATYYVVNSVVLKYKEYDVERYTKYFDNCLYYFGLEYNQIQWKKEQDEESPYLKHPIMRYLFKNFNLKKGKMHYVISFCELHKSPYCGIKVFPVNTRLDVIEPIVRCKKFFELKQTMWISIYSEIIGWYYKEQGQVLKREKFDSDLSEAFVSECFRYRDQLVSK